MAGGGGSLHVERTKRGKNSKRKKKKRIGFVLDMTPLVDITFLLLTFFMFTTTMAAPQIMEMSIPPEVKTEIKVKERELMSILVRDDGKIFWFIGNDDPETIEMKKIKTLAFRENIKEEVKNRLITVVKVSDNAPYGLLIGVLDQLNLAEVDIISELAKMKDAQGNPLKRERRFTIAPFDVADMDKIKDL